jgi:Cu-processing system permease protein
MNAVLPLAINGFREARRNKVSVVVFLFAFVMIFSATFALELTVVTFERVLTDFGLGVMSLIASFLAIFLGSGLIPKEIERKTIFMVVSKPISRASFIVGRYLGNLATVLFVTSIMTALFLAQILWDGAPIRQAVVVAIGGLMFEVCLLSAICFVFAAFSSQFVTTVASIGLYFLGHLSTDLYRMADKSKIDAVKHLGKALYYVLPNLDRLDWKSRATYGDPTAWSEFFSSGAYALGYSVVLLAIACILFERRDFK